MAFQWRNFVLNLNVFGVNILALFRQGSLNPMDLSFDKSLRKRLN